MDSYTDILNEALKLREQVTQLVVDEKLNITFGITLDQALLILILHELHENFNDD